VRFGGERSKGRNRDVRKERGAKKSFFKVKIKIFSCHIVATVTSVASVILCLAILIISSAPSHSWEKMMKFLGPGAEES